MAPDTLERVLVDRLAIWEMPWTPYRDRKGNEQLGVSHKMLFEVPGGRGYVGLFKFDPGAELVRHTHRSWEHHAWIVEGGCVTGDRMLQAGSYEYTPAGVEHGVDRAGPDGCTLFYVYLSP